MKDKDINNNDMVTNSATESVNIENKDIVKIRQESIKLAYSVNKSLVEILKDAEIVTNYILTGETKIESSVD